MPAILKGFIDKVFVARYAFKYVNGRPVGLLKGKTATIFVTSGGPKAFYTFFRAPKRVMQFGILKFCGISSKYIQIGGCMKLDAKNKAKIRKTVAKAFSKLDI